MPTESVYDSQGWRWDVLEWLGLERDPRPPSLQAEIFRGLDLPVASLRSLHFARRHAVSRHLFEQWCNCQVDLAWQEWTKFGRVSSFREQVVRGVGRTHALPRTEEHRDESDVLPEDRFDRSLLLYRKGRTDEALAVLPLVDSQAHFAAAMLALELGDPARARAELAAGLAANPERGIGVALRCWQHDLSDETEGGSP
jgi:hypothetical protein